MWLFRIMPILTLSVAVVASACTPTKNIRTARPACMPGGALTVMSFNIRVGYGTSDWGKNPYELRSGPEKLEPIVAAIHSIDPDIVGLQEVLTNGQARRIAKALNFNYSITPHPNNRPWWGVAILSKHPISDARAININSGRGNAKNALLATVDVCGRDMVFASIHKDKDLRNGGSFRAIRSAIEGSGLPTVLIGDFNVRPGDRRFALLGGAFTDTARVIDTPGAREAKLTGTWGSGRGARIDYILVRPVEFDVVDAGIVASEHRRASDHYGYFAKIKPYGECRMSLIMARRTDLPLNFHPA